eukprot:6463789-Amphidinium_carterae.2
MLESVPSGEPAPVDSATTDPMAMEEHREDRFAHAPNTEHHIISDDSNERRDSIRSLSTEF